VFCGKFDNISNTDLTGGLTGFINLSIFVESDEARAPATLKTHPGVKRTLKIPINWKYVREIITYDVDKHQQLQSVETAHVTAVI
jgi:hypothetical protein